MRPSQEAALFLLRPLRLYCQMPLSDPQGLMINTKKSRGDKRCDSSVMYSPGVPNNTILPGISCFSIAVLAPSATPTPDETCPGARRVPWGDYRGRRRRKQESQTRGVDSRSTRANGGGTSWFGEEPSRHAIPSRTTAEAQSHGLCRGEARHITDRGR